MESSCNHLVICYCSIDSSNHHSLHPTKTNANLHPPSNRGHDELPNPISAQSATFQLKSITFVPYILASSSDSYDPKTSVAKFHAPSNHAFFRYIFHPLKTCDHTVLPKLHRRFGHLTLTRRGHHGKDLGLLAASIGDPAKNQPEMIP